MNQSPHHSTTGSARRLFGQQAFRRTGIAVAGIAAVLAFGAMPASAEDAPTPDTTEVVAPSLDLQPSTNPAEVVTPVTDLEASPDTTPVFDGSGEITVADAGSAPVKPPISAQVGGTPVTNNDSSINPTAPVTLNGSPVPVTINVQPTDGVNVNVTGTAKGVTSVGATLTLGDIVVGVRDNLPSGKVVGSITVDGVRYDTTGNLGVTIPIGSNVAISVNDNLQTGAVTGFIQVKVGGDPASPAPDFAGQITQETQRFVDSQPPVDLDLSSVVAPVPSSLDLFPTTAPPTESDPSVLNLLPQVDAPAIDFTVNDTQFTLGQSVVAPGPEPTLGVTDFTPSTIDFTPAVLDFTPAVIDFGPTSFDFGSASFGF